MALGDSGLAGVARVAFEAVGVGETIADTERVERSYRESLGSMSTGAIKLELAEERLQRALRRGPTNYRAIAQAELGVRRARSELERETRQLERSEARRIRTLGGLRSSLLGYAGALVGVGGVFYALRQTVSAAREEELILGQTRVALEATGLSWDRYARRIETVIGAQSRLGFDDEELLQTFSVFIRRTRDVDEALRLNALTADVARGRYIDLSTAQNIVLKASIGMGGQLRRLGLDVDKNATSTELLAFLTRNYGKAAEEAATTAIGAQDRFNVAIENTKEAIGQGLLPTVSEYTDRLTDWLDKAENQEELQRRVNAVVEDAGRIVRGFAGGLELAHKAVDPLVDALGGVENTVKALTILWVAHKVKAVLGFAGTALASRTTSAKMVHDATVAGRAWDVATRPRTMVVTTAFPGPGGGGAPVPRGGAPTAPGRGGRGSPIPILGVSPQTAVLAAGVVAGILGVRSGRRGAINEAEMAKLITAARQGRLTGAILEENRHVFTDAQYRTLRQVILTRSRASAPTTPPRGEGRPTTPLPEPSERGARRFTFGRFESQLGAIEEAAIDAAATGGTADDVRVERRRLELARRALRELDLTREQRIRVKQERNRALQALAAIEQAEQQEAQAIRDQRAAAAKAAADKAAAAQKAADAAEEKRMDAIRESAAKAATRRAELFKDIQAGSRAGLRRSALRGLGSRAEALSQAARERQEAQDLARQFRTATFEFLTGLRGTTNQIAGNLHAPGSLQVAGDPRVYSELRQQTRALHELAAPLRQPGTRYAGTEIAHLFDGPTF